MTARQLTAIAFILLVAGLLADPVCSDDWPRWRGPAGDGVSRETGWDPQALAGGAEILWNADVGMGHSSVVVQDEKLYTMGNRQLSSGPHAGEHEDVVSCLDAVTGREIWHHSYPCEEGEDPGPGSTPTIDGDALYTIARNGELLCLDAADGRVRWRRNLLREQLSAATNWGFAGSPLVEEDLLLLNGGASGVAFDKHSGRVVWSSELEEGGISTPVVFEHEARRLAAFGSRSLLWIVDPRTGEQLWSHPDRGLNDSVVIGSRVLVSGSGTAEMLQLSDEGLVSVWRQGRLMSHFQTPVLLGEHLYGINRAGSNNAVQCVSVETGELKWSHDIGPWGALVAADNKLLIIDDLGTLIITDATPEGFRRIAAARVLEMADNTGIGRRRQCHCWTAPALANGLVYVRNTFGNLACVDLR